MNQNVHYVLFFSKSKSLPITRKSFSEKPRVAFTNITVFVLDFYILLSLWSQVLALRDWTLKKAEEVSCQEASAQITNICIQEKYLTN